MSDYNELISYEVNDLSQKIDALLVREGSCNLHGVSALLLQAAVIMDQQFTHVPTTQGALAVKACLDLISAHPDAYAMLL